MSMTYRSSAAFRQALDARLKPMARERHLSVARLRKEIAFDRLLARLLMVAPDRWVLKGGVALDHRLGDRARATNDIDLGRRDNIAAATTDLQEATKVDLGDYLSYAIQLSKDLSGLREEGVAARYHAQVTLGRRLFENTVIDVGFDAPPAAQVDYLVGRDLLSFAGLPAVPIPTLPLAYHIAEKVHAYTGTYGREGRGSTRVKDLIDLALIATSSTIEAVALVAALEATFARRGTHALPSALPVPPSEPPMGQIWSVAYTKMASDVGLDDRVAQGHATAARCVDPVLNRSCGDAARWNPATEVWESD